MVKIIMIFALSIGTLWDGFTTLYGTQQILGNTDQQIAASIVFTIIIFGFMVSTMRILRTEGQFGIILKILWFISFVYDFYTSYVGNVKFIGGNYSMNDQQIILITVFTILATSSPMLVGLFTGGGDSSRN